jgi:hypothetical protein
VVGRIGASLAEAGLNIEDVRHSHFIGTDQSLAILKLNRPASEAVVRKISAEIQALMAFALEL